MSISTQRWENAADCKVEPQRLVGGTIKYVDGGEVRVNGIRRVNYCEASYYAVDGASQVIQNFDVSEAGFIIFNDEVEKIALS